MKGSGAGASRPRNHYERLNRQYMEIIEAYNSGDIAIESYLSLLEHLRDDISDTVMRNRNIERAERLQLVYLLDEVRDEIRRIDFEVSGETKEEPRGGGRRVNKWIEHTKKYAKQKGIKYSEALKDPNCKKRYNKL